LAFRSAALLAITWPIRPLFILFAAFLAVVVGYGGHLLNSANSAENDCREQLRRASVGALRNDLAAIRLNIAGLQLTLREAEEARSENPSMVVAKLLEEQSKDLRKLGEDISAEGRNIQQIEKEAQNTCASFSDLTREASMYQAVMTVLAGLVGLLIGFGQGKRN
jgi:hypothetical protein